MRESRAPPIRALSLVFVFYGLSVCWAPYLPLWQRRELGFSAARVGALQAAICVAQLFGVPLFCAALDALGNALRAELFAAAAFLVNGGVHAVYLAMPNFAAEPRVNVDVLSAALGAIVVGELLRGACGAMLDVACLRKLGPEHRLEYGRVRLWISLMWGLGASMIGVVHPYPLSIIFLLSPVFSVALLMAYHLTLSSSSPVIQHASGPASGVHRQEDIARRPSYAARLQNFVLQSDWRVAELTLVFLLLGSARRSFETFVYLLLADLGGRTQLMGLATLIQVISELPAYFYFQHISKHMGSRGVLYLSASCYLVRAMWYANVKSAWGILLVEPLHGITFALLLSSVVTITADASPEGLQGTAQGVLARGVFDGAGGILGSAVGGILYDKSPAILFHSVAVLVLTACMIMGASDVVLATRGGSKSALLRQQL